MKRLFSSSAAWRRRADVFLAILALLGVGLHVLTEATRRMVPQAHLQEKLSASTRALRCFEAIRQVRLGTPEALDAENDPEASGLIGQEFTLTTTDRGVLEAKLTSVNPNFAAVFVSYFHELKLKPGDPVAIALTGSFPALNIAVLAAVEEMRLTPIAITSVGASMWGATDPQFSWLDMEHLLIERGLLHARSAAASLGGSNDRGRGLSPKGRTLLREAIRRNGVPLISEPTLDGSIRRRIAIFDSLASPRGVRVYVNIGGGSASTGTQQNIAMIESGINRTIKPYNFTLHGVLHHYAKKRVPIVHVLNVETIAARHGLPLVPETVPPVGEGEIFYREAYDLRIVVPALAVYLVLCFGVLRARHRAVKTARELVAPAATPAITPAGERSAG